MCEWIDKQREREEREIERKGSFPTWFLHTKNLKTSQYFVIVLGIQ